MLIHTRHVIPTTRPYRAVPWPWRNRFQKGMAVAWHGRSMDAAWHVLIKHGQTVNQMGKTRLDRGTAWTRNRNGMARVN
jgi:hypothetical protein